MKNIVQFSISLTSLYVYYDGFLVLIFKYDQKSNVSFALLFLILISIVTVISWLCTSVSALIVFCIFLPGRRWLRFPIFMVTRKVCKGLLSISLCFVRLLTIAA